ncbi:hypothetical protein [Mucilaginibacter xinganensis]|uniref:DUF1440 domain-containing protein n=1 Tax=Mucilaginibacter xinganensis TaxID=1234841 RepID=A0A223NXC8_9SPHI|nr:hypothetical protein [Mucilaginibacter xinganensis]ASU34515.1 hypothetical protein MuYL_2628 [Mucilaginibacter xinganensis]
MKIRENNTLGELGTAIGIGLLAGLAGTAAITLSQAIEMKITKRAPSEAPVKVAKEITGIKPSNEAGEEKVSQEIHWAYGTAWGIARGLIGLTGLKGLPAAAVHFASIWGTAMVMLPAFKASPPVTEQKPKAIAIDALHHAVYALAAGAAYDALDAGSRNQRRLSKMLNKLDKLKAIGKNFKYA